MKVYAYGEDALTLWAIKNRLSEILSKLGDETKVDECKIFFRPSFGRGGKGKSNFGEFDFILLTFKAIYLGESKWDGSSEKLKDGLLELRPEQLFRHNVFKWYMDNWTFACPQLTDWKDLIHASKNREPKFPKVEQNENEQLAFVPIDADIFRGSANTSLIRFSTSLEHSSRHKFPGVKRWGLVIGQRFYLANSSIVVIGSQQNCFLDSFQSSFPSFIL
ncbi:MAG: hypothetical protein RIR22_416 [Planctomycetota bacterium]|jgi:hypothetical protein